MKSQPAVFFRLSKKDNHRDELVYILSELRRVGQVGRCMRDWMRLGWDLMCGNRDVLLELYPSIVDSFKRECEDELRKELQDIKRLLLERPTAELPETPMVAKPMIKKVDLSVPIFEDDDMPTVKLSSSKVNSAQNFMNAFKGIQ